EYPDLIPAKLIIARCFINRKEYSKSLAILNAIPEHDRDFDVTYYMALTQSRLGDVREAIANLKRVRSASADTLVRKRANDLLLHLQGEKTVCPACGKQTLYDSMVDIGDQTVCTNCAKIVAEGGVAEEMVDEDDIPDDAPVKGETRRRKRLRPPLTKWDILVRIFFALFILPSSCSGSTCSSLFRRTTTAPSGLSCRPVGPSCRRSSPTRRYRRNRPGRSRHGSSRPCCSIRRRLPGRLSTFPFGTSCS
ncbi:MAG: tetratricopeptide repeat protein, partial [Planctomycetes bacterium]|nr:tetratricopeptide repeat protein [Planctomycetota bacterium]